MAHDVNTRAMEIRTLAKTNCIAFKPDGYHLVAALGSGYLREWRVDGGQDVNPSDEVRTDGIVYAAVVSVDGRWIVSGDSRHSVTVRNAATHEITIRVSEHTNHVRAVDVSSDSTRFASGSHDNTARIFDITSGVRVIPPLQHKGPVVGVKFSPDGSRIATATLSRSSVRVYDARSGSKLFYIQISVTCSPVTPLAWSSDGQQFFVGSPGQISFRDASPSALTVSAPTQNANSNVSIASHGELIVCSAGASLSFWDSASCQQVGSIIDHPTSINCIAVSHDGRYLACGHDSGITVHKLDDIFPRAHVDLSPPEVCRFPLMQMSEVVLESWRQGNPTDTESILSQEIAQASDPTHYVFVARSFIRSRLKKWEAAMEDAERSLQIQRSPIGQIARAIALIGIGQKEAALADVDFAFRDGDPGDIIFLLVIKSVLVFLSGKHDEAVSRLRGLITFADENMKCHWIQVLGNMYLKQGDYESAVQTLKFAKKPVIPQDFDPLLTISLIFNWDFDHLETTAWQRLCETFYRSGRVKEVGETLLQMIGQLPEAEKELAHGRILEEIVTRSGEVILLAWTGKSSTCNSCLPSSPSVYGQESNIPQYLAQDDLKRRADGLRDVLPLTDALIIHDRLTRLQPVRFTHFRLHLPCIVFNLTSLRKEQGDIYYAKATGLGDVEFTTTESLSLKKPQKLVFVDTRVHIFNRPHGTANWGDRPESDAEAYSDSGDSGDTDEPVHAPMIEEAPSAQPDAYIRALQLIAHFQQSFSALLLLQQSDGAYKRVAADHEIAVCGIESTILNDLRVEVLEIL